MSVRRFSSLAWLPLAAVLTCVAQEMPLTAAADGSAARPNILLIMADDITPIWPGNGMSVAEKVGTPQRVASSLLLH
jgi:hypothetical protein